MRTASMDGNWFEKWLQEHKESIRCYAGKERIPFMDKDELFQELTMACLEASQKFNPDSGVAFSTYAAVVMKNRLITLKRRNFRT